jgi:hypothetical protein
MAERPETFGVHVSLRVQRETAERIDTLARDVGMRRSEFVRALLTRVGGTGLPAGWLDGPERLAARTVAR